MVNVSAVDGIAYGFRILLYGLVVLVIAAVVFAASWLLIDTGEEVLMTLGGVVGLVGALVVYAGVLGLLYKVIADGVERGVRAAGGLPLAEDR